MGTSSQNAHFWGWSIFFWPSSYPINFIFPWQCVFIRFMFWWSIFPITISIFTEPFNVLACCKELLPKDMPDNSAEWSLLGHVTNKIHISTCRRCIDTTIDKALTYRLPNMTLWSSDQHEVTWLLQKSISPFSWGCWF